MIRWLREQAEKRRRREAQMERDYQAGKLQFANRPYSFPKASPPPPPRRNEP